jgi:hypothetical protein
LPTTGFSKKWFLDSPLPQLTIITRSGDGNHFIKLENALRDPVITLFVRDGERATVNIPAGVYTMKSASGTKWYGERFLFGPESDCSVARKLFEFTVDETDKVSTYTDETIELFTQPSGNLDLKKISIQEF